MEIYRNITVKAVVTRLYKEQLLDELRESLNRLDMEIHQLEFQSKRLLVELEKQSPAVLLERKQQLDFEKKSRCDEKLRLAERIRRATELEIGAEVRHSSVQGLVNVEIGDDWDRLINAEIVLEDGKVVEIRE